MRARSAATVWAAVLALAAAAPAAAQAPVARAQPVVEVQQRLLAEADADGAPLEITVANAGKAAADEVTVTDSLPPGGVLVSASPMPVRQRNQLVWPIGRMEPGERRVLRLKVSVPTGPELRNNVQITFLAGENTELVVPLKRAALALTAEAPARGFLGDALPLKMTVTNPGTAPARGVVLVIRLPGGLVHPYGPELENDLGTLNPGESRSLTLPVTAKQAGAQGCLVRAECKGLDAVERTASVAVAASRVQVSSRGPTRCPVQQAGHYELHVRATAGAELVPAASLRVLLPEGFGFAAASHGGRYDPARHCVVWELKNISADVQTVLSLDGVARQPGEQEFKAVLQAPKELPQELLWSTQVDKVTGGK